MDYIAGKARDTAVSTVTGLLKKWYAESKPGKDRTHINRFKYDADNVRLFGRDEELAVLWEFCHADNHFSWYAISGEGGSGKTRLAYTLGNLIERYAIDKRGHWNYHKVDYAHEKGLAEAEEALKADPRNTLLVLDYVKWHTDSIGKWLYGLWREWHDCELKIRVLLVERDAVAPHDLNWQHDVMAAQYLPDARWKDALFLDKNNLLRLQPLRDEDIIKVVEDFADSTEQRDLIDAKLILKTLKETVDPTLRRPLYALFLSDAQITGEDLLRWERKDALEYIYLKEKERIANNASGIPAGIVNIICHALLIATLSGGMEWDKFAELLPKKCAQLQKYADDHYTDAPQIMVACLGIPYSEYEPLFISPLEPDLMGEFFCIQELLYMKEPQQQETVGLAMCNDLRRAAVVFDRVAHDYDELLVAMKMEELFTAISLPDSITTIGNGAFEDCKSLINIIMPDSITSIGQLVFVNCESLSNINIPSSVTIIGEGAFWGCKSLTSIVIPDSIASIGGSAFEHCESLINIVIPDSVPSIDDWTFAGCKRLTSINIPVSVTSIGEYAFNGCKSLTSITIPDSVTSIGEEAFFGCESLTSITIPDSVVYIGDDAFLACPSLKTVYVRGEVADVICKAFWDMDVTFIEQPKD